MFTFMKWFNTSICTYGVGTAHATILLYFAFSDECHCLFTKKNVEGLCSGRVNFYLMFRCVTTMFLSFKLCLMYLMLIMPFCSRGIHFVLLRGIPQVLRHWTFTQIKRTLSAPVITIVRSDIGASRMVVVLEFSRLKTCVISLQSVLNNRIYFSLSVSLNHQLCMLFAGWSDPDEVSTLSWKDSCSSSRQFCVHT